MRKQFKILNYEYKTIKTEKYYYKALKIPTGASLTRSLAGRDLCLGIIE